MKIKRDIVYSIVLYIMLVVILHLLLYNNRVKLHFYAICAEMYKMDLLIVGAGGYGQLVKEIAKLSGYKKIDFLDDNSDQAIGKVSEHMKYANYKNIIVAIGKPDIREKIVDEVECSFNLVSIVHPRAVVSDSAIVENGCVIEANAVVSSNTKLCKASFVNAGAVVNHNAIVREFCQIDCNAVVGAGREVPIKTKVESCSFFKNKVLEGQEY